ncbi:MAG: acylglycerol kinase family protein, partial [Pseudonocardiales bacterium]
MRVLVVVNPNATATTVRERDVLAHALGSASDLQIVETANRGHAAALACRAMRDGADIVVALGGDGTVNEVVNGLLTDGVHDTVPALGIVPAGSTNVF